jgi:hypothetical protein
VPIAASDIERRLSGGATNADPNASLGGAMSVALIPDATLHNIFDVVTGAESAAGSVDYRCFYFRNAHATLTLQAARVWIAQNTPSPGTDIAIGLDPAGVGGTPAAIANENVPPNSVAFTQPSSFAAGLVVGDVPAGAAFPVWVRRTVSAGAAAYTSDSFVIQVQGDTAP